MGGGAALFDMDADGDLDAYLVQSGSVTEPSNKGGGNRLFRNRGNAVFDDVTEEWWDDRFYALETREEVAAYCRHCGVDPERAESAPLPLWLTKRGVLVRATA